MCCHVHCSSSSNDTQTAARAAQALVSVSTIGTRAELDDRALAAAVQRELGPWFGEREVAAWQLLRVYRIPFAQPNQARCTVWGDASSKHVLCMWRILACPV